MSKFRKVWRTFAGVAGFTMIELLVVIAVIGVLAVAVLSSINPIEQINKGRDTRTRSDSAQLINAVDRFYSIHEIYPWNDATYVTALGGTDTVPGIAFPDGTACVADANGFCDVTTNDQWVDALATTAEVKTSFSNRLVRADVTTSVKIFKSAVSNATMYACFTPTSKAFEDEALEGCIDRKTELPTGACDAGTTYTATTLYTDEMVCLP